MCRRSQFQQFACVPSSLLGTIASPWGRRTVLAAFREVSMGSGSTNPHAGGAGSTSPIARAAERFGALQRVFLLDAWMHELELMGGSRRTLEHFARERDRLVRVHRLDDEERA